MTISQFSQWDGTTAANNVDLNDNPLTENTMRPRHVNDAFREMMKQLKSALGSAAAPQFDTIELGHASDTTLSRGAAGFMAVEGKRVPSPASQASGDILYRGATEWERLAKGTAYQTLRINSGATAPEWATAREVLTANRTYYVRTDGSDSNDGLADTAGGAFLTIQKAFDVICTIDLNGKDVTVQIGDGTYTAGLNFNKPWVGGNLVFQGNSGTPANVVISVTSANGVQSTAPLSGVVTIKDLKITCATGGSGLLHNKAGLMQIANLDFGACVTAQIQCQGPGADILVTGNYAITGACARHFIASEQGRITAASRTITITGTPAFSTAFADASRLGLIMAQGMTFSGSATGARYSAITNAVIHTGGGGATYFPGNAAGSTATGGQYV